jgi:hypothetical protein
LISQSRGLGDVYKRQIEFDKLTQTSQKLYEEVQKLSLTEATA